MTEFHQLRSLQQDNDASANNKWKSLNIIAENRTKNMKEPAIMPSMDHTTMKDFQNVYEPSDDTYLLLDGIKIDLQNGQEEEEKSSKPTTKTILEIGCGSGVPIVYLTKSLTTENNIKCVTPIATDINPKAIELTQKTALANNITNLQTIQCDLATDLLSKGEKYSHQIDYIIFNPPYVPTPDEEIFSNKIEASWAGGERGRRVIDRAIPQICQLLKSPNGICYMITVDDNEPSEIADILFEKYNCTMIPLVRRRAHNEYLTVQKITCNNTTTTTTTTTDAGEGETASSSDNR